MRANEIIVESSTELKEAPVGALSRFFTNIGAKMGLSGSQIQKQFNDEMMQIRRELNPVMRQNGGINSNDFVDFMSSKGYGNASRNAVKKVFQDNGIRGENATTQPLDKKIVDDLIKTTIGRAYLEKGAGRFGRYGSEDDKPGVFKPQDRTNKDGKAVFMRNSEKQSETNKIKKMKEISDLLKSFSPEEKEEFKRIHKEI